MLSKIPSLILSSCLFSGCASNSLSNSASDSYTPNNISISNINSGVSQSINTFLQLNIKDTSDKSAVYLSCDMPDNKSSTISYSEDFLLGSTIELSYQNSGRIKTILLSWKDIQSSSFSNLTYNQKILVSYILDNSFNCIEI